MIYSIILSGGMGTRFWPVSTQLEPKQFLNIHSERPMIEETISRVLPLLRNKHIFVAANNMHRHKVLASARRFGIPLSNCLFEPSPKSTLAPIGLITAVIEKRSPGSVVIVLPCDHLIRDKRRFLESLRRGVRVARLGHIVVLGVPPTRPDTGYGYIQAKNRSGGFCPVVRFTEKPELKKARHYLKQGDYYWNAGMFIFRSDVMLAQIRKFAPLTYSRLEAMKTNKDILRLWPGLEPVSLDRAVMEKTKKLALIPAHFGWTDLGSWEAAAGVAAKDKRGNSFIGPHVDLGSTNSYVLSQDRLVATIGLKDIVVVSSGDAILVCRKDRSQEVGRIAKILKDTQRARSRT